MDRPINRMINQQNSIPEIPPQEAVPVTKPEQQEVDYNEEEARWAAMIEKDKQELEQLHSDPKNIQPDDSKIQKEEPVEQPKAEEPKQEQPSVQEPAPVSDEGAPASVEDEDAEIAEMERRLAEKKAKAAKLRNERNVKIAEQVSTRVVEVKNVSEEEQKKHQEIAEKNNVSNRVFTDNGSDEDLGNLMETLDKEDARTEEAKEENPSPALTTLVLCEQIGQRTRQQRMMNRFIKELGAEKNQHFKEMTETDLKLSKINPHPAKGDPGTTVKLKGAAARLAVISRTQGLYRIMLYNSGFWITVHTLSVADAAAFVHEVDADFQELGRIIGGQFHLVLGAYLKNKVMEILPNLVISSNLEGFEDPSVLGEAISIHDYDTILWGICCSMYRDGIGIGVHCTNPECRHIDQNQYVDLTRACYINPEVFNEEAMVWMRDTRSVRTLEDCVRYRNNILKSVRELELEPGTLITLKVPSLQFFANKSIELVGKMQAAIYKSRNQKTQELKDQMTIHFYKMLAPWVSKIVYLSKDDTHPNTLIEDYDAISTALEIQSSNRDNPFYEKIEAYIRDTKCSIYTLTSLECPKCHKKPNLNSDGVFPLDVEYLFFGLSCRKLEQTGMTL